jgi:hypothetical protein
LVPCHKFLRSIVVRFEFIGKRFYKSVSLLDSQLDSILTTFDTKQGRNFKEYAEKMKFSWPNLIRSIGKKWAYALDAKQQETVGPFYEPPIVECPTSYPIFSPCSVEDIHFYKEPILECTLYAIQGSSILYQSFKNEKALPSSKLVPSEMQLSQ